MPCTGCTKRKPGAWGFRALPEAAQERMNRLMRAWVGTPYRMNVRVRGEGVDCWQLGAAILDGMDGRSPTPLAHTAHDAGMNRPSEAVAAVKEMIDAMGMEEVTRQRILEPGDFLATGSTSNPYGSHLLIQSPRDGIVLESPMEGTRVKLSPRGNALIRRVYRVKDRAGWNR